MQHKERIGQKFGSLLIVDYVSERRVADTGYVWYKRRFRCVCDCGKEVMRDAKALLRSGNGSCGCVRWFKSGRKKKDVAAYEEAWVGKSKGDFTVAGFSGEPGDIHVEFDCSCGKKIFRRASPWKNIWKGITGRCPTSHWPRHRSILEGMKGRCYHKGSKKYRNYGGRGIKVCDRWRGVGGLRNFIDDMGTIPGPEYSIDRIDNDGDYSPENCRWATHKEQCRNTRVNRVIEINGEKKCVTEWAEIYNINIGTLFKRLNTGWDPLKAVTTPPQAPGYRRPGQKVNQFL
jgi:hypothetical protein